jgi:hypothetical protein
MTKRGGVIIIPFSLVEGGREGSVESMPGQNVIVMDGVVMSHEGKKMPNASPLTGVQNCWLLKKELFLGSSIPVTVTQWIAYVICNLIGKSCESLSKSNRFCFTVSLSIRYTNICAKHVDFGISIRKKADLNIFSLLVCTVRKCKSGDAAWHLTQTEQIDESAPRASRA